MKTAEDALEFMEQQAFLIGRTWDDLAEDIGVHSSTLARWAKRTSKPTGVALARLLKWFEDSMEDEPESEQQPPDSNNNRTLEAVIRRIVQDEVQKSLPGILESFMPSLGFQDALKESVRKALVEILEP